MLYICLEEILTDISFSGQRSYLAIPSADLHLFQTCIEFELKPSRDRGLVLFTIHPQGQSFISIAMHGGILELRLKTIGMYTWTSFIFEFRLFCNDISRGEFSTFQIHFSHLLPLLMELEMNCITNKTH